MRTPLLTSLALVCSALATACSTGAALADADDLGEDALAATRAEVDVPLPVRTSESPSGGNAFTFCANPTPGSAFNLTNAAWLAMASANEYAHLRWLAPQLLDLGFGSPTDRLWEGCAEDLFSLKSYEERRRADLARAAARGPDALTSFMLRAVAPQTEEDRLAPVTLGTCGRAFFDPSARAEVIRTDDYGRMSPETYRGRDTTGAAVLPSKAFRDYLVRTHHPGSTVQFFSASPRTYFERRLGKGSTQAFVARHATKPVVIVAFRGTEVPDAQVQSRTIVDVLSDLTVWKTDTSDYGFSAGWGRTHRGFMDALEGADDVAGTQLLTQKIRSLVGGDPGVGVWITGHSLGGAVATLLTARLLDLQERGEPMNLRGMYTFGAPRVGNETFATRMEAAAAKHGVTLVRFRNDQDLVTSVPYDFLAYRHVGTRVMLEPVGLRLLDVDPARGTSSDDHDIVGLVPSSREAKSGYYARLRAQLERNEDPALVACDDTP